MPSKPLTQVQRDDAARLKALFRTWQDQRKAAGQPSTQEYCSGILGFGQSTIVQYLSAKIPLNVNAARKFAGLIGVNVEDFSPALADRISELAEGVGAPRPEGAGAQALSAIQPRSRETKSLKDALAMLATAIESTDDLDWVQGSALLKRLAEEPGRARDILQRLEPILAARRGTQETAREAA